jgi:membrane-bound ClpP family serine protease
MTEGVFLTIAIAGAALLIGSILLGDLFELFNGFDLFGGVLSTTAIGLSATLFGANGYFLMHNGSSALTAIIFGVIWIAIGLGIAIALDKWVISKTEKVIHNIVGRHGTALTKIDSNLGKVQVDHYSEANSRFAFSDSDIPAGTKVVILEEVDGKVKVQAVTEKEENAN